MTVATISAVGPLLKKASARSAATTLPAGFTTGVSDAFERLAQEGGELALRSFDELVAANAHSIRFPIDWNRVQPKQGGLDWSHYDALYQVLVFHGLNAHPVILGCPEWLGVDQRKRAANGVYYPTGPRALDAYGEFAIETVKHFLGLGDQIEAIEVWSEPNNPSGAYIADPAEFARMLGSVAQGVDRANGDRAFPRIGDRDVVVLAGGIYATAGDRSWEEYLAAFEEQAFPYALALHVPAPAAPGAADGEAYAERSAEAIGALVDRAAAQTGREIWVTGTGARAVSPWGDQGQALAMASIANALAERSQCRAMMVTGLRRSSTSPEANAMDAPLPKSGLLRGDGTPTPALATLQTAWAATE